MSKIVKRYKELPIQMKAAFWFMVCSFLQRGVSMITMPIFTRIMDTTEYGTFSVFISWQTIAGCVVTLSLYSGVYIQAIVKFEDDRRNITAGFQGLTAFMIFIWGIVYLISQNVFTKITGLTFIEGFLLLGCIWIGAVFSFWAQEQRSIYEYKKLVVVTLIHSILSPALSVFFILHVFSDKVFARIMGIMISGIICYGWMFLEHICGGSFFSVAIWKYAVSLAIPLIPHYLSQTILNNSDRIMIEKLVGKSQAGIYSVAYSLSMLMVTFISAIHAAVEPWIYRKIRDLEPEKIGNVAYPLFLFVAILDLMLIVVAPEILMVFAPRQYYDALWVIPPVAMGVYFIFVYSFFAAFEFYFEKTKYITIATLAGATVNLVSNYFLIKAFGYYAAGYTTLLCYIIYAIMHYVFMKRICAKKFASKMIYDSKLIFGISALFILCGFIIMYTYKHTALRYGVLLALMIYIFVRRDKVKEVVFKLISIRKEN